MSGYTCLNCNAWIEIPYPAWTHGEAVCKECGHDVMDDDRIKKQGYEWAAKDEPEDQRTC